MPRTRSKIPCDHAYDLAQMGRIREGLIPQQMEDKWFVFWEKGTLHFHRSWTGFCVFRARFEEDADGGRMVMILANRNPDQYKSSDDHDAKMVPFLVKVLLLHEEPGPGEDPFDEDPSPAAVAAQWHQIGRAMIGEHPD